VRQLLKCFRLCTPLLVRPTSPHYVVGIHRCHYTRRERYLFPFEPIRVTVSIVVLVVVPDHRDHSGEDL
jgi:hypothetical protein